MFGRLFRRSGEDQKVAQVMLTYLVAFHRAYAQMGEEFMLGTIKRNPLISHFQDQRDFKTFFIEQDLGDFQFTYASPSVSGAVPMVVVSGREIYRGFSASIRLDDGVLSASCTRPSTARAQSLVRL